MIMWESHFSLQRNKDFSRAKNNQVQESYSNWRDYKKGRDKKNFNIQFILRTQRKDLSRAENPRSAIQKE